MCHIQGGMFLWTNIHSEKRRNVELRREEDENTSKDSKPTKHLKENLSHKFSWKISLAASENKRIHKILEVAGIAWRRPSSKEQIESKQLLLFCNGVTLEFYNF